MPGTSQAWPHPTTLDAQERLGNWCGRGKGSHYVLSRVSPAPTGLGESGDYELGGWLGAPIRGSGPGKVCKERLRHLHRTSVPWEASGYP